MKKSLRTVKTTIVFGILLASLFIAFGSNASAGPFTLTPYVDATYDTEAAQKVITPIETTLTIPLFIKYSVTGPLVALGSVPEYISKTTRAYIDLEIVTETVPSFCTATLSVPTVNAFIAEQPQESTAANLQVSVNDNAPGFEDFTVQIKITARKVQGLLVKIEKSQPTILDVRVKPKFAALINVELPKGNYLEIGPMDTADFEIMINNLGNAPTVVNFEILDIPKDWSPNIQTTMLVGSGLEGDAAASKTVVLRIKPPYGFGYHSERETIRVKVTPTYYRNPDLVGRVDTYVFTIQSRGFSTPGFESALVFIALAGIAFIYIKKKRKN